MSFNILLTIKIILYFLLFLYLVPFFTFSLIYLIPLKYIQVVFYFITIILLMFLYPFVNKTVSIHGVKFQGNFGKSMFIKCLYVGKDYEPDLVKFLKKNLKSDDIFIDVGANIGYFSIIASTIIKNNPIYAIEPDPNNVNEMNNNIKINNIKNIKVLDIAASNKNTTSDFYVCNVNSMWNQVGKMNLWGKLSCLGYKKKKLKFRKLSKILDLDTNKRKVIKIDVEGHETEVINDLMHLIKNKKENNLWIVETDKMNIIKLFKNNGYYVYHLPISSIHVKGWEIPSLTLVNNLEEINKIQLFGVIFSNWIFSRKKL